MAVRVILRIYRAQSGQWAGQILEGSEEIGRVSGCKSARDVEEAALRCGGYTIKKIEHLPEPPPLPGQ
ncbi:hypothetical protein HKW90_26855 [Pseudomonas aeruginosa]|nr:hypothetical protein [Pseudomonas aeruginosa]